MPVMPVILWTDALVYLLIAAGVGFGLYAARRDHLREPWRRVARSRIGMGTLVVLAFFVLIGLLDTFHFRLPLADAPASTSESAGSRQPSAASRFAPEVLSLFDVWATPLRKQQEKTYSAPFATHLFVKEAITRPDGTVVREYPRLQYGGSHLKDPGRRGWDIAFTSVRGLLEGLIVWGLIAFQVVWTLARRRGRPVSEMLAEVRAGRTDLPWRTILGTLAVMLVLGFVAGELALKYHIFGTDKVGEDVFFQTLKSIRTGLVIGTLTTLVMLPAALLLGIMAGYFRGWVDDVIQYLYTTLNAIPGVLLIAAAVLMLQVYMANHAEQFGSLTERADLRLLFLCLILGVTSWTGLCRLLRGEALKLREVDYVQAAAALGVGHFAILGRHILPNVGHIVMITLVLDFSGLVLAEAVLSYVNIGVDPTMNSWGNMINSARLELARDPLVWWSLAAAFLFMFTLVLAANLFADVVRDAFDPRLRAVR